MDALAALYMSNPFWIWVGLGALILGIEVLTGSGYLLWPAASAGIMALVSLLGLDLGLVVDLEIYAALTLVTTLGARQLWPNARLPIGPNINDPLERLVGRQGRAADAFKDGQGRVLVDGKEWAAEAEGPVARNQRVEVLAVVDGAKLKVQGAAGVG